MRKVQIFIFTGDGSIVGCKIKSPSIFHKLAEQRVEHESVAWDGSLDTIPKEGPGVLIQAPENGGCGHKRLIEFAKQHGHVVFQNNQLLVGEREWLPARVLLRAVIGLLAKHN